LREESGKRRHQLKVAKDENARLRARVEASDRAAVESIVGGRLHDPSDFWSGVEMSELRDDDGALDRERIGAAVSSLIASHPHYGRPRVGEASAGLRRGAESATRRQVGLLAGSAPDVPKAEDRAVAVVLERRYPAVRRGGPRGAFVGIGDAAGAATTRRVRCD
jgi:3',5'-cyclic AMP phosphodiesterase CpdA